MGAIADDDRLAGEINHRKAVGATPANGIAMAVDLIERERLLFVKGIGSSSIFSANWAIKSGGEQATDDQALGHSVIFLVQTTSQ